MTHEQPRHQLAGHRGSRLPALPRKAAFNRGETAHGSLPERPGEQVDLHCQATALDDREPRVRRGWLPLMTLAHQAMRETGR